MPSKYLLAIDQGTTGTRAVLFDDKVRPVCQEYREITQYYPYPGWVEQDPEEIWKSTICVVEKVIEKSRVSPLNIEGIGICNQRETVVFWDKDTGSPAGKAIVWQCRRTVDICEEWKKRGLSPLVKAATGLSIDPYFSASKIKWAIDNIPAFRHLINQGKALCGTIDSYLIWKFTGGKVHLTDYTNASRTMLFNIHSLEWDKPIMRTLGIPEKILPLPLPSSSIFGHTAKIGSLPSGIPISCAIGDQQASLFGHGCTFPGSIKNTYGTGCFLLLNIGKESFTPISNLITTLACDDRGMPCYALEGSIFIGGAVVQWLKEGLEIIQDASQTEKIARDVNGTGGVYFVPALVGLGAPYWDAQAKGAILGITRGTKKQHIVRASLEAIAYQVKDLVDLFEKTANLKIKKLKVDGGASRNNFLMQFQSDILGVPVERSAYTEVSALGVALLAGLTINLWDAQKIVSSFGEGDVFLPEMNREKAMMLYNGWRKAVYRVLSHK